MIQADKDIKLAIASGAVVFDPFDPTCVGTNSYDVKLARTLRAYALPPTTRLGHAWSSFKRLFGSYPVTLDCKREAPVYDLVIPDEGLVLYPGHLYLAATIEYTEALETVPFLEGKSSLGRLGLSIHVTAGKGDVGFCGHWTAECTVIYPLRVYAGMPIGQVIFHGVSQVPEIDYAAKASQKYAAQHTKSDDPKPVASRMYKNFPDGVPLSSK